MTRLTESQLLKKYSNLLREWDDEDQYVDNGYDSMDLKTALELMKKYEMKITSYGSGLGIEFYDDRGLPHYEESNGQGNTQELTIEAMVSFAMKEIAGYGSRVNPEDRYK